MFAGIIERVCNVVAVWPAGGARHGPAEPGREGVRLEVELGDLLSDQQVGASVAINGVCLTLAELRGGVGGFDVVPETWRLTNLARLEPGQLVNVERALRLGDRIDGHFVQGHVDGVGRIERVERERGEYKVWVVAPRELMPYIIRKGSITLDGTSLTVVEVESDRFSVALIPTTLERTTLGEWRPGDQVNIETDILARLVISRLEMLEVKEASVTKGGVSWERLQESGFAP